MPCRDNAFLTFSALTPRLPASSSLVVSEAKPDGGIVGRALLLLPFLLLNRHPQQGVLQDRQLVLLPSDVLDQALDQRLLDVAVLDLGRLDDRLTQLVLGHARQQVMRLVQCLGQTLEARAVTEVLGAHRGDDVDPGRLAVGYREQDFDQACPLGVLVIGPVAEDLLELIDQQQKVFVFLEPGFLCRRGQTVFACVDQDPEPARPRRRAAHRLLPPSRDAARAGCHRPWTKAATRPVASCRCASARPSGCGAAPGWRARLLAPTTTYRSPRAR